MPPNVPTALPQPSISVVTVPDGTMGLNEPPHQTVNNLQSVVIFAVYHLSSLALDFKALRFVR